MTCQSVSGKALLRINEEGFGKNPGGVGISHTVTHAVPSTLEGPAFMVDFIFGGDVFALGSGSRGFTPFILRAFY